MTIRLGDGDLDETFATQTEVIRGRAVHPSYVGRSRRLGSPYYDVAVLTIDRVNVTNGGYVRPICLPDEASDNIDKYEGDQVDVAGFSCCCHYIQIFLWFVFYYFYTLI